jgi:hypothetical protein
MASKKRRSRPSRRSSRGKHRHGDSSTHDVKVVAERTFTPTTTWTVSRHTRPNGTGFWQLTEMSGRPFARERTDWPVVYDDGRVVYDRPEQIPARVREWCGHILWPYRNLSHTAIGAHAAAAHERHRSRS